MEPDIRLDIGPTIENRLSLSNAILIIGNIQTGKTFVIQQYAQTKYSLSPVSHIRKQNNSFLLLDLLSPFTTEENEEKWMEEMESRIIPFCQSSYNNRTLCVDDLDFLDVTKQNSLYCLMKRYESQCQFIFTCTNLSNLILSFQYNCTHFKLPVFLSPNLSIEIHSYLQHSDIIESIKKKDFNKWLTIWIESLKNGIPISDIICLFYQFIQTQPDKKLSSNVSFQLLNQLHPYVQNQTQEHPIELYFILYDFISTISTILTM